MPAIELDWDDEDDPMGNVTHIARHQLAPEDVEEALADPHRLHVPAYSTETERRWGIVGAADDGRIIFVVYTRRSGRLRVVTARPASGWHERQYRRRRGR